LKMKLNKVKLNFINVSERICFYYLKKDISASLKIGTPADLLIHKELWRKYVNFS